MPQTLKLSDSLSLLSLHGIPVCEYQIARVENDLENISFAFPWVLKLDSTTISHKTEQNALRMHIQNLPQARSTFNALQTIDPTAAVIIQPQLDGVELIIGSYHDDQFGSVLLVGVGGILVELIRDSAIRVVPISLSDANDMISELKHQPYLDGFRNKPAVDRTQLAQILAHTSDLLEKIKPIELDINPLMATSRGLFAVDARIVK